jgi:tetratricopeptide (TPR) repeat protein
MLAMTWHNLGKVHSEAGRLPDARKALEQARSMRLQVVQIDSKVPFYLEELAASTFALGVVQMGLGQLAEALGALEQACTLYDKALQQQSDQPEWKLALGWAWHQRSEALRRSNRRDEALTAVQQAIHHQRATLKKSPKMNTSRVALSNHLGQLGLLHREARQHARAAEVAHERAQLLTNQADELYNVACDLALCVPLVGQAETTVSDVDMAIRLRYADEAMVFLRKAVQHGFKDGDHIRKDDDLIALHGREDFKTLLASLEKPKP